MALRTRSLGGLQPVQKTHRWWTVGDGSTIPEWSTGTYNDRIGSSESMTDYVTPNFRKLQAEGRIVNNPMSKNELTVSGSDAGWKFSKVVSPTVTSYGEWSGPWGITVFGIPAQPSIDGALLELLVSLASTKALAGVESAPVMGQVIIAEMHKTISMLRNPLKGLTDFIRDSRQWKKYRGRKPKGSTRNQAAENRSASKSAEDGVQAAANCWLEARFGWRPFLMDMEAILKTLREGDFSDRKTSRAMQERVVESTRNYVGTAAGIDTDFTETIKSTYEVRAGILYQFQNSPQSDFGFSWSEVPISTWELIPFSFVVDWFINVGDYIQAMTPKSGTTFLAAWHKISIQHDVERRSGASRLTGWTMQRGPYGVDRAVYKTTIRSPDLPPPKLVLELDVSHALRNNRGWDALGLFTSIYMGGKSKRSSMRI